MRRDRVVWVDVEGIMVWFPAGAGILRVSESGNAVGSTNGQEKDRGSNPGNYKWFFVFYQVLRLALGLSFSRVWVLFSTDILCFTPARARVRAHTCTHTHKLTYIQSGPKTCINSCSSSAASTVFGCRWWPLRTRTLNPKFKNISHINFAFV